MSINKLLYNSSSDSSDSELSSVKLRVPREPEHDSGSNLTDLMEEFEHLRPSAEEEVKPEQGPVKEPVQVRKPLSGAQKRKRKRQRAKGEGPTGGREPNLYDRSKPGCSKDPDGPGKQGSGTVPIGASEPETPSPEARKRRRTDKGTPGPSFAEISAGCRVAVVPVGYPNVSLLPSQVSEFAEKLLTFVDSLSLDDDFGPGFWGFTFQTGGLLLNCVDQRTKDWLGSTVGRIQLGNLSLQLETPEALVRTVRVGGHFPGSTSNLTGLVNRLAVQNPRVRDLIRHWVVVGCKAYPEGGFFAAFKVPETQIKDLERQNFKLHYSIVSVRLQVLENTRRRKKRSAPTGQTGTRRYQGTVREGPSEPKRGSVVKDKKVDRQVSAPTPAPDLNVPTPPPLLSVTAVEQGEKVGRPGGGKRTGRLGAAVGESSSSGGAATGGPGNEPST